MRKIIWLASYPKSGNTWMRVLLTNYLRNSATPVDINKLEGGPIASARLWFDEWVGVEAAELDDNVIERLRPGVYRCMAGETHDTLYMKVHDAWGRTDRGEALFPADVTAGVVYIVRNPLDMAMSCAHHWGVDIDTAAESMCDPTFATSRSLGGLSDQLRQSMLSWSGHVQSWLDESGLPVHVVRYEDLLAAPAATFGGVVRFCGLPFDAARVGKAVAFSDFSELQRQEREKGFRERSLRAPGSFFRRGQAGAWREELPPELVNRLIAAHGEMMKRFGYTTHQGGNDNVD
ncbi:sulfotransferase domain-containing protein [Geotalea uraniireducens]|uniref:Sulfotransferase n=1 Tax=Geotalea uraniireducens (strain Rf4) TaxID=351605 RepID=A5GA47_GEOUR|nr:sulfotransferase domain-containing protein [Geotalea uraniireducens]ABQ25555.1 sulfotransferase [Geotalea uraniireducens Rf4]